MPIDHQIPLMARPAQMPDLMDVYTKAQQLQSVKQQNRLQAQAAEENDMKLGQLRQALQDDVAAREIVSQYPDIRQAAPALYSRIGPEKASKVIADMANMQSALSKMDESEFTNIKKRTETFASAVNGIKSLPEEQRPQAYRQAVDFLAQNGLIDPGQIGQGIPAEYPGDDIIDLFSRSVVGIENQMKQQIAALRADAYSKNIDSLADSRKDKSAAEIEALKIRAEDLQRQIDRDANLDDRSRDELRARLQMHRETLAQRAEEERGRTRRHELSEDGRNTRAREQQAAIDRRAQAAMKAGIPPTQMLEVINKSLDAMGMNSIHDLDEDTVESFNNLVDSALQGLDPQFGYQPGGWFGWGSKATVSTGAPLNPQPQGVFPQEQPPQSFQPAGQPMNLPPLSPGKVYVSGPDGEGLFELPEAQLNDYLKANPKAKAYRAE